LSETRLSGRRVHIHIGLARRLLSNEQTMEDEKIEQGQEVWSAIRYLDPDEVKKDRVENDRISKIATVMTLFVFAIILVVWVMLCFRGL
jgi:type IV secretory pathway component VirB8